MDNPKDVLTNMVDKTKNIKSLRDVALEFLREAIISGYFQPGVQLKERELSELLGISTTPIKEALRVLTHDGLVETLPRRGTFVSEIVDTSIEEFMMIRAALEGVATKLATLKATKIELESLEKQIRLMDQLSTHKKEAEEIVEANSRFHKQIRELANNQLLNQILVNLDTFDKAFRKRALMKNKLIDEGFKEHNEIFNAIKAGESDCAEKLMKEHILATASNVLNKN